MKKINNIFKATKRDGTIEKILSKLPENPAGYSAILADLDKKLVNKGVSALSECDEDFHPAMHIPTTFFFKMTPMQAKAEFDFRMDEEISLLQKFIEDFFSQVRDWTFLNDELLQELVKLCDGTREDNIKVDNLHITPEIEKAFVALAKKDDRQDRLKRIKFLAAINLLLVFPSYTQAAQEGDIPLSSYFMFLMTRSMAQFAANKAVDDGLDAQNKRRKGGEHPVDREGLLALIRGFNQKHPNATEEGLWIKIRDFLIIKKRYKPCVGYSVKFEIEPTDMEDTGGTLLQTASDKKTHPMQFQAFRRLLSEIRN
jgi:hypothetical protein